MVEVTQVIGFAWIVAALVYDVVFAGGDCESPDKIVEKLGPARVQVEMIHFPGRSGKVAVS